jgi:hypothetical protein
MIPTQSVLAIDIYEPDTPRAVELLAAVAAKLGLEQIDPGHGETYVHVHTHMEWHHAYEPAERALDEAGDEDRMIVRPIMASQ